MPSASQFYPILHLRNFVMLLKKNLKNSEKKLLQNIPYTCKQSLMVYKKSESAGNNFGKFIHQFQPETKTLIRKLEKILIKLYKQNMSLLFNQTGINAYIYIYIGFPKKMYTH